jgi:deoxyribose-phosphate aldolase
MFRIPEMVNQAQKFLDELPPSPGALAVPQGREIAGWIDHTNLHPDATSVDIADLCAEAVAYGFASVCVNPTHVPLAAERCREGEVEVCTVAGFPLGANMTPVKAIEASSSIDAGASEIDMVINIGALKEGAYEIVLKDIQAVAQIVHTQGTLLKVIIETALLTRFEKIMACLLVKAAGADYIKTSTGFSSGGAVLEDVELMYRIVAPDLKVKAAGGIGSYREARAMIEAGASRIGASAGVAIVEGASG